MTSRLVIDETFGMRTDIRNGKDGWRYIIRATATGLFTRPHIQHPTPTHPAPSTQSPNTYSLNTRLPKTYTPK